MRGSLRLLTLVTLLLGLAGAAAANPDGVAVIIGNKTYQGQWTTPTTMPRRSSGTW